jgi:hypothetical protein
MLRGDYVRIDYGICAAAPSSLALLEIAFRALPWRETIAGSVEVGRVDTNRGSMTTTTSLVVAGAKRNHPQWHCFTSHCWSVCW